jgi:hypothetical protein
MREFVHALRGDYKCETSLDACEPLEYLNTNSSIPDLIVVDINMPKNEWPRVSLRNEEDLETSFMSRCKAPGRSLIHRF